MAASYESLRSRSDFEVMEVVDQQDVDTACSLEMCATCDDPHDHTEMIYCDGCEMSFCEECFHNHLDVSPECRYKNGAD